MYETANVSTLWHASSIHTYEGDSNSLEHTGGTATRLRQTSEQATASTHIRHESIEKPRRVLVETNDSDSPLRTSSGSADENNSEEAAASVKQDNEDHKFAASCEPCLRNGWQCNAIIMVPPCTNCRESHLECRESRRPVRSANVCYVGHHDPSEWVQLAVPGSWRARWWPSLQACNSCIDVCEYCLHKGDGTTCRFCYYHCNECWYPVLNAGGTD